MSKSKEDWLLEFSDPAVRYRALVELMGCDRAGLEARTAKRAVAEMPEVQQLFDLRAPDGFWRWPCAKAKTPHPDPMHCKNWDATVLAFQYLAEFGLDGSDLRIDRAVTAFLALHQWPEDFQSACRYVMLLRVLVMLGYEQHPKVAALADRLRRSVRWDNGLLCDGKERRRKTPPMKSCVRATTKALMAFADASALRDTPEAVRVAEYFRGRRVLYRRDQPEKVVRGAMVRTGFPFENGFPGLLELVYGLSALGYGRRPELADAWRALEAKRDSDGRYRLDYTRIWHVPHAFPQLDSRGAPSKWATLYALMARKRAGLDA